MTWMGCPRLFGTPEALNSDCTAEITINNRRINILNFEDKIIYKVKDNSKLSTVKKLRAFLYDPITVK